MNQNGNNKAIIFLVPNFKGMLASELITASILSLKTQLQVTSCLESNSLDLSRVYAVCIVQYIASDREEEIGIQRDTWYHSSVLCSDPLHTQELTEVVCILS